LKNNELTLIFWWLNCSDIFILQEREGDLTGSQKEMDEKKQQLASSDKDTYYQVLKNEQDERLVIKLHKILKVRYFFGLI